MSSIRIYKSALLNFSIDFSKEFWWCYSQNRDSKQDMDRGSTHIFIYGNFKLRRFMSWCHVKKTDRWVKAAVLTREESCFFWTCVVEPHQSQNIYVPLRSFTLFAFLLHENGQKSPMTGWKKHKRAGAIGSLFLEKIRLNSKTNYMNRMVSIHTSSCAVIESGKIVFSSKKKSWIFFSFLNKKVTFTSLAHFFTQ